jgi:hypothetical protein
MSTSSASLHESLPLVYGSPKDVSRYFDVNPKALTAYVANGLPQGKKHPSPLVLGTHVAQLARKVGIPLECRDSTYESLPDVFVNPLDFENIHKIITAAYSKFH